MKIILLALHFLPCCCNAQPDTIPADLNWLLGTWTRLAADSSVIGTETWKTGKGEWTGIGTIFKNGDTIITETIMLKINSGKLNYIADVKENSNPVSFNVTAYSDSGFICENPHHDFPKKIEYTREGRRLSVFISGNQRKREFRFLKSN